MIPTLSKNSCFAVSLCSLVTITWLLTGCRSSAPTPTPPPAATAVVAVATATPAPSATVIPTPAAILTPTAVSAAATPDTITYLITTTVQPRLYDSYPSPDGKWRAEVMIYDCTQIANPAESGSSQDEPVENAYEQLTLINRQTGGEQIADSQLQNCGGLGAAGLAGLFWSSNSLYFYYTDAREGVPDGCGYWSQPIRRLDVQSLSIEELGGGPKSPDGTMYATWQGQELLYWQIDQAAITRLPAAVAEARRGPIAWSPDNQALVYLQFDADCPPAGKSYLVHVDLATGEQHILIESDTPRFRNVTWYAQSQLILFGDNSEQWYYDLATGTLEPVP